MITIFTPTYNRGYIISSLYHSLQCQTNKNFEWLIVDDGSTDNTFNLVNSFKSDGLVKIKYIRQENGGKHRAINRGVIEAQGELFFIVDSDDYLIDNAVEMIYAQYESIKKQDEFAGVSGCRSYPNGERIGGPCKFKILECSSLELRYKYNIKGDMAEVYRTEVLRQYPFPDVPGEKFCAESFVWNRIAQKYKMKYFNENIYVGSYLPDGLTKSSVRNRRKSPSYATMLYAELLEMDVPFKIKCKSAINYWRFAFLIKKKRRKKIPFVVYFFLLIGFILYLRDSYIVK